MAAFFFSFATLIIITQSLFARGNALSAKEPRVALITGANKGIGFEIAKKFAADPSFTTILACRTNGEKAAKELGGSGKDVHSVYLELTDDESIAGCRDYVEKNFGSLDVLVNNAAICFNDPTLYGKVPHTPFHQQASITIETNYFGTKKLTEALLPLMMLKTKSVSSPRIINIASSAGRLGIFRGAQDKIDMFTHNSLTIQDLDSHMREFVQAVESGEHAKQGWPNTCYGMSKVGIIALTRILARDHPNMFVNSVDPGYCATDQNNNQGTRPAERGAITPFLLATTDQEITGLHWFDEQEMPWSYGQ